MADSRLCKPSLQLIFVTFSWSTTIALSFLELAEVDGFGHANVFHVCDVASPVQLQLKQDGLYAGRAGSFSLLRFSFAALCLSASNLQLAFLADERQLSRSEASCCHD